VSNAKLGIYSDEKCKNCEERSQFLHIQTKKNKKIKLRNTPA